MPNPQAADQDLPQPGADSARENAIDAAFIAGLVAVAGLLRFHQLSKKSFWFDEGVSVAIARLDWYNFGRLLWRREANMSLYYLLLRAWLHFGHGEAFIRALSVWFALATIPVIYCVGRALFDRRTGLIAATLLSVNAFQVAYSQEARSYTLFVLLGTLSALYFVRSAQVPSLINRLVHIAASVCAVYAHFFAVLLIGVEWLSLYLNERQEVRQSLRNSWRWIMALAAPVLIFVAATGAGPLAWIPRPGLSALYRLFLWLSGDGGPVLLLIYALCCLPVVIARVPALSRTLRTGESREGKAQTQLSERDRWGTQFLLLWILFPLAFIFLVSQIRPLFLDRYFLFLQPALALIGAAGLVRLRFKWLGLVGLAILLVLSLRGLNRYYDHDYDLEHEDWRSATRYVLDHAQPGDAIIFHTAMGRMPYEYYRWDLAGPLVIYPRHGETITFRDFYGHLDDAFLKAVPSSYPRVWIVFSHNQVAMGGDADDLTVHLTRLFGAAYAARPQKESFAGIEVNLYGGDRRNGRDGIIPKQTSPSSDAAQAPR